MSEFTPEEIDGIVKAMSQQPQEEEESGKIPLRPPGSYGTPTKVAFSPIEGEKPRPLSEWSEREAADFKDLKAQVEVVFGKTKLSLKELSALKEGSLLPFDDLCDDLVDIYVNGAHIGRGEVIAIDGHFAVKIIAFAKN